MPRLSDEAFLKANHFFEDSKSSEDQKVLSLAEQFIAAMPARIKNESDPEAMLLVSCRFDVSP